MGPGDLLRALERAPGPGALQRPNRGGGGAGLSGDGLVEQRGKRGDGAGAGAAGPRRGGATTARTDQSSGEFACAQISVDRFADPPDAGRKGPGGIDGVVSSPSGKRASRPQGAPPQTIALPLLSLSTPRAKNCVLNMKTLFQRQCTPTLSPSEGAREKSGAVVALMRFGGSLRESR